MEYKKIEKEGLNIHLIKNEDFKKNTVVVKFKQLFDDKNIIYQNMLSLILAEATSEYKSQRLIDIECENLYNLSFYVGNENIGWYSFLRFDASFLDEEYTEKGMTVKSLSFLFDLIFKPFIENEEFNHFIFNKCKSILKDNIISNNDNPTTVAVKAVKKIVGPSLPYSYDYTGTLEDLEKVTPKNLYEYYKKILNEDFVDIFIAGVFNEDEVINTIDSYFSERGVKEIDHQVIVDAINIKDNYDEIKDTKKVKQSTLVMGLKISDLTPFERDYSLRIFDYIFGGGPSSRLFKSVREKNSLCYSVFSSISGYTNLGLIIAGIQSSNYEKARDITLKEFELMKKELVTDRELDEAKQAYLSQLENVYDTNASIVSVYENMDFLGADDPKTKAEKFKKVTKEDVLKVGQKIHLDVIYLLEGSAKNE